MELLKNFSIDGWFKQFGHSCRRFPVAVVLMMFLTAFLIAMIHGAHVSDKWLFFFIFYPATGSLLAVSLKLLTEDFKRTATAVVVQVAVHMLWLGISLYLTSINRFSLPQIIAVVATVVTMVMSVFLLCFYRKGDDVPFWNFSLRVLIALAFAIVIGTVVTLGLVLFIQSLNWLFGIELSEKAFADVWAVCMVLLAPLLFINLIPDAREKRLYHLVTLPGFVKGVVQFLFIPLLSIYVITLYIYAAQILFTWQLPVGWVCYLVTASMVGMVALLYFTYPLQHEQARSVIKSIMRWMPLAILPLLVLMSVAIGRRLSDYGITVSRLYVVVFNVWCYVVCIGLLWCRNKRIWWVPTLFATALFLTSVGPLGIPQVTQQHLRGEASKAFAATGVKRLPLSGEQYEQWLQQADSLMARSIDAKLHYLNTYYGHEAVDGLLAKDALTGRYCSLDQQGNIVNAIHDSYSNDDMIHHSPVPQGYSLMTMAQIGDENIVKVNGDKVQFRVNDGEEVEHVFELDIKQLVACDRDKNPDGVDHPLVIDNGEALLMVDDFDVTVHSTGSSYFYITGILFTR